MGELVALRFLLKHEHQIGEEGGHRKEGEEWRNGEGGQRKEGEEGGHSKERHELGEAAEGFPASSDAYRTLIAQTADWREDATQFLCPLRVCYSHSQESANWACLLDEDPNAFRISLPCKSGELQTLMQQACLLIVHER